MLKSLTLLTTMALFSFGFGCDDEEDTTTEQTAPADAGGNTNDEPSIAFAKPSAANETADASFDVEVTINNAATDALWSLSYFTAESNEGVEISEDISTENTQLTWDTSSLPTGTYFLRATLVSEDMSYITESGTASVAIQRSGSNTPPTLTLTGIWKDGYESFKTDGGDLTITYSTTDEDTDSLSYEFEVSTDDGSTWTAIPGAELSSVTSSSASWDASAKAEGIRYRIRARVTDNGSFTSSFDSSSDSFGLTDTDYSHTDIDTMLEASPNYCGNSNCHDAARPFDFNSSASWSTHAAGLKSRIWSGTSMPSGIFNSEFHDPNDATHYPNKVDMMLYIWQADATP